MEDINLIFKNQKEFFESGKTINVDYRIKNLKKLNDIIKKNEDKILNELKKDLGKSNFEGYVTEVGILYDDINFHIKNVKKWSSEEKRKSPIVYYPSKSYIYKEPYGVTLIIGPFNYPFQLVIAPLIGAISAGNTAIIKPSENSRNIALLLEKLINENFPEGYLRVVNPLGGKETVSLLLDKPFDYIFFTGSQAVGREVMRKAAEHLTPVSLELGGKSPCIIDRSANLKIAAKRVVFGKYLNCGQTCVAPDYIYCHADIKDAFIAEVRKQIALQYGDDPLANTDYGKIINAKHFNRIKDLIDPSKVVYGGSCDETSLKIAPTVMDNITRDDAVMKEEIFGPVMPVMTFTDYEVLINDINSQPHPLALYIFASDRKLIKNITSRISFGGGCVNDTIIHLATSNMGFGGVGASGMGSYHGRDGFNTFSHYKSIVDKKTWLDLPMRYQPYRSFNGKLIRMFLK